MDLHQYNKSEYKADVAEVVQACNAMRRNIENPRDISLADFVRAKYGVSMDSYYNDLGLNPSVDTIQNIFTLPDSSNRFLIPEIIRDALRLGMRKAPIWSELIAAEQTIKSPTVTIPWFNMSDATPNKVNQAENIPIGNVSFGSKQLKISKIGKGIKIPYEVQNYVSVSIISLFLQDFGIKLNHGIDALAIDCLINGEQADGSESAPIVGVATVGQLVYLDFLTVWVRMSRLGRMPNIMIGGEASAITTLNLPEFKTRDVGTPLKTLNLKTPVPNQADYYIHGSMPTTQTLVVDTSSALIKYNAQPLLIESDKIISNQTIETYATLTTGFGILYRDARVIIDTTLAFSSNGFPPYMNIDPLQAVIID